jgi:hypothetical protein
VSVGNQCVVLKGINDSGEEMLTLHRKLLEMRVRAYYMYDPEVIPGSRGFRTPLAKGLEIIEFMRGKIAGMGIPQFVNDLPGGGGKVTLSPNWYVGFHKKTRNHIFRSALRGTFHLSPEPIDSNYDSTYLEISDKDWEYYCKELDLCLGKELLVRDIVHYRFQTDNPSWWFPFSSIVESEKVGLKSHIHKQYVFDNNEQDKQIKFTLPKINTVKFKTKKAYKKFTI